MLRRIEWRVVLVAVEWQSKCVTWFISHHHCLISADLHHPVQVGAGLGPAVPRVDYNRPQQLCTE